MSHRRTLRPTLPSAAVHARFRSRLDTFVADMDRSLRHWVLACYRRCGPVVTASDARLPANMLEDVLRKRLEQWIRDMNRQAEDIAEHFVQATDAHVRRALGTALRAGLPGVGVRLPLTRDVEDVLQSLVYEQTSLIRSIPSQYATEVEGLVMRSVRDGRDEGYLLEEFGKRYDITVGRARTIARDQTNKATESISRTRCATLGIRKGVWMHRSGSKHPRGSHVRMNGTEFDLAKGCYDPDEGRCVMPGELVNCNCTYRPVLPEMGA